MNPIITLIVPVFNTQPFLVKCLDSIVKQSFLKVHPLALEVLLIDDASTDGSLSLLMAYQRNHPEIFQVIGQRNNAGLGATRNLGLSLAQGEYVGFVDSDDWIHPDMCMSLLAEATNSKADYISGQMFLVGEGGVNLLATRTLAESTSVCNKLFRRGFIEQHQLQFAEGELFEDEIFSYLAHHYAKRVAVAEHPCYYYRENPQGICRAANNDARRLYARMSMLVHLLETMKSRDLLPTLNRECLELVCRHALLQLTTSVCWVDLQAFWGFCEHLIERYQLNTHFDECSDNYFVSRFLQTAHQPWRLWLLRQSAQLQVRLAA